MHRARTSIAHRGTARRRRKASCSGKHVSARHQTPDTTAIVVSWELGEQLAGDLDFYSAISRAGRLATILLVSTETVTMRLMRSRM